MPPENSAQMRNQLLRAVWLLAFFTFTGLTIAGIPLYFREQIAHPHGVLDGKVTSETILQALEGAGISRSLYAAFMVINSGLSWLSLAVISLLVVLRRARDRNALILSLMILGSTSNPLLAAAFTSLGPVGVWLIQISNVWSVFSLVLFFYLFPDGRFVPRWIRWMLVVWGLFLLVQNLWPGSPLDISQSTSPASILGALLMLGSLIFAQVYRYLRVSGPVEKLQTRWVVTGMVATVFAWFLNGLILPALVPGLYQTSPQTIGAQMLVNLLVFQPLFMLFPIGLGFSMLRYRLWDLDLIIRRTLVYAVLSVLIALVYFGTVVALQQMFRAVTGQDSPVAIVISTLTIAVLFTPLRSRVQQVIDRRFFRQRYDGEQALSRFHAAVRTETDLNVMAGQLTEIVDETIQPERISLWIRTSGFMLPGRRE